MSIKIKTQAEWDAIPLDCREMILICPDDTENPITISECKGREVAVFGNSKVVVRGNSRVVACDNTSVEAYDCAFVTACDFASVVATDLSIVEALGNSVVEARSCAIVNVDGKCTLKLAGDTLVVTRPGKRRVVQGGSLSDYSL